MSSVLTSQRNPLAALPLPLPVEERDPTRALVGVVFGGAVAYTLLRYVALGATPAAQLPVYLLNKATSLTAVVLLAIALALTPILKLRPELTARWGSLRKTLGLSGFGFAAVHSLLSFAILTPAYYGKLFTSSGRMTGAGELAVLAGAIGLAALILPALTSFAGIKGAMATPRWRSLQRLAVVALAAAGVHVAAIGIKSWTRFSTWPGALPPITLVAFAAVAAAFILRRAIR